VIDVPAHHLIVVDGPGDDGAVEAVGVADEARSGRPDEEDFLEGVEGDGRRGEELAGVGGGEADVGDGEAGEMVRAEGKVFDLGRGSVPGPGRGGEGGKGSAYSPNTEYYALIPGPARAWRYGSHGLANEAHDRIGVVVNL
jgi:hypothetical protein